MQRTMNSKVHFLANLIEVYIISIYITWKPIFKIFVAWARSALVRSLLAAYSYIKTTKYPEAVEKTPTNTHINTSLLLAKVNMALRAVIQHCSKHYFTWEKMAQKYN